MMWWASGASLVPGMHGRVALGRGNGLRQLAGLEVGIGGHDDGAARLRRVRVLAVDVLEFLGGLLEVALVLQGVGVGEYLARRIGIERPGGVAGAGATAEDDDGGKQRKALQDLQHARASSDVPQLRHPPAFVGRSGPR